MRVLIVESNAELGAVWQRHIGRHGHEVVLTGSADRAVECLRETVVGIVVLNLVLQGGSAFAVADFASYRQPEAKVIFVTDTAFFADGSIFQHVQNAAAFLATETDPDDLAALVDYYGGNSSAGSAGADAALA